MSIAPRTFAGQRYGRLLVIEEHPERIHGCRAYVCMCDCGERTVVSGAYLREGQTRSCGCLRRETEAALAQRRTIHGHARKSHESPTYRSWMMMINRCTNPNATQWKYYGGRGITVCEQWRNFENFLEDMGERPAGKTLDRIDPDGNYEPANCRWATALEQRHNRRAVA